MDQAAGTGRIDSRTFSFYYSPPPFHSGLSFVDNHRQLALCAWLSIVRLG